MGLLWSAVAHHIPAEVESLLRSDLLPKKPLDQLLQESKKGGFKQAFNVKDNWYANSRFTEAYLNVTRKWMSFGKWERRGIVLVAYVCTAYYQGYANPKWQRPDKLGFPKPGALGYPHPEQPQLLNAKQEDHDDEDD